jgi:glycosyltransferase involved in cell wall biosynthesis
VAHAVPLASVLIPNYNYGRFVGMALQSLLNQTYPNFEALVCDDRSTDNSREVIQEYGRKDSRIKMLVQANRGFASAVNTAYESSKGEVICLLDADDMFRPRKLETVMAAFRSNPRSGLCVHPLLPVSAAGQPLGPPSRPDMDRGWIGPCVKNLAHPLLQR